MIFYVVCAFLNEERKDKTCCAEIDQHYPFVRVLLLSVVDSLFFR